VFLTDVFGNVRITIPGLNECYFTFIAFFKKDLATGVFLFCQPLLVFYKNKGAGDFA